ncbi:Uncharacterised protein [Corynebacterium pilosum]|uniref:Secreted protein n=1 Tax=Corynebacterium pilosum TaxID=35756 RepID=A0A376CLC9_9CORY|nr:Uncharacterised protein [Corynebacterium pilosum]
MKRLILAATVILPLTLAGCDEANDEPETLAEPTLETSTVTSEETTSSDSSSSEESAEEPTSEEPEPNLGPCDPGAFNLEGPTETVVPYCDGQWAHAAKWQTDHRVSVRWDGSQWTRLEHQGELDSGAWCYDHGYWLDQGAPAEFVAELTECY